MPKGKKRNKKATQPQSSDLLYFSDIVSAFNKAHNLYSQQGVNARALRAAADEINQLHLTSPNTNKIPAIIIYLTQKQFDANYFTFLTTLKSHGLQIIFTSACNVSLIHKALKNRDNNLLLWLVNECQIKIPTSGLDNEEIYYAFNLDSTGILDYIEENLGSSSADFYINLIANHHSDGNNILHLAAIHNRPRLFDLLATNGADINQPNFHGVTPAMFAVEYEDSKLFSLFFNREYGKNLDVSLQANDKTCIFHRIIFGKSKDMLRFALERLRQQELNFSELTVKNGYNIVHWAIETRQCSLLFDLFPLIDINAKGPDGNHLIIYAFINDEPDMGAHIARSCKINLKTATFDGKSILDIVIEHDAVTSFIWLTNDDEDYFEIDTLNQHGIPPVLLAAQYNKPAILCEILEGYVLTAEQLSIETTDGKKLGHYLAEHNNTESIEELLKENKLDLKHTDAEGNTVLDILLLQGQSHAQTRDIVLDYLEKKQEKKKKSINFSLSKIKQLKLLIEVYCADELGARKATIDGVHPIVLACQHFEVSFVQSLVKKNRIDINTIRDNDESLLCTLIKRLPSNLVIEFINKLQPKTLNLDKNGSNILHLACEHNIIELVSWCLEKREFNITKRRLDNFSALDLAIIRRSSTIVHLLWSEMKEQAQKIYIKILETQEETILLDYLTDEGLYTKPEPPPAQEISKENTSVSSIRKLESIDSFDETTQEGESCTASTISTSTRSTSNSIALSPIEESLPEFTASLPDSTVNKPCVVSKDLDILTLNVSTLNVNAKSFESLPQCFLQNPDMRDALRFLTSIFITADIDGFIYGSSHYKLRPGDIDILIPEYNIHTDFAKIKRLIDILTSQGGVVTSIDPQTGEYGYSYEGRYIVPISWQGIEIELVVSPKTILEHALELDFTNSARYLSVRNLDYAETPGINAKEDIKNRRVQTIINPETSFQIDPRRIFRGIKQVADEGLSLSTECQQAIQNIFAGSKNPFLTISIKKIYYRMEVMLKTQQEGKYFAAFNKLGIFDKLFECFAIRSDYTANYFKAILAPYQMFYAEERQQAMRQRPSICQYSMYSMSATSAFEQSHKNQTSTRQPAQSIP